MSVNILLSTTSAEVATQNATANSNFIDAIGNKSDAANVTAAQASIIGLLRGILANYSTTTTDAALIGALTDVAHTGAVDDATTLMAYLKQLVVDERLLDVKVGAPAVSLAVDIAAIKTVVDLIAGYTDTEIAALVTALTFPTADLATDATIAQVVGKKADTVAGTSLVALVKQVIAIVNGTTTNSSAVKREAGRVQVKKVAITSAANAGLTTIGTVTTKSCLIKSISLRASATGQVDLTSAAIKGGGATGETIEFISAATAAKTAIDTVDEQVNYNGVKALPVTGLITIDLQGTGATVVALEATIEYVAVEDGGYIA